MSSETDIPKTIPNHALTDRTRTTPAVLGESTLVIGVTTLGALVLGTIAVGAMAIRKIAIGQLLPGRRTVLRRRQGHELHAARLIVAEVQVRRLLPWRKGPKKP
jgi:hypothetical protein